MKKMKKSVLKEIFDNIKHKLVFSDLYTIAESINEKGRQSRDFIEVKTLGEVFEEMAKEGSNDNETKQIY